MLVRQGRRRKSSRYSKDCWKKGTLHHELALACVVLLWGRFCGKRHSSFCRRHDGTSLPESLRQTARQRALLFNGQRCLGILQRGGWVSARRARRRFQSAGDKPHPRVRPGRAAHQHPLRRVTSASFMEATRRRAHEEPSGPAPFAPSEASTSACGRRAAWFPTSVRGCSALLRIGSC